MQSAFEEWATTTKAATFMLFTEQGYIESWTEDIVNDIFAVFLAAAVVSLYIVLFMGSFSPIHCRCLVALAGISAVILSFFSGFGLLYYCGLHTS